MYEPNDKQKNRFCGNWVRKDKANSIGFRRTRIRDDAELVISKFKPFSSKRGGKASVVMDAMV